MIRSPRGAFLASPGLRGLLAWGASAVALVAGATAQPAAVTEQAVVRIGFSARTIGDANRNDVLAALKVWADTVARERRVAADPHPEVFATFGDMEAALRAETITVISVPADEFVALEKTFPLTGLFSSTVGGSVDEEYLVLVRQDRSVQGLAELLGGRLVVLDSPRCALAPAWLDTELLRRGLPESARFFREIVRATKVNRAILPVFFQQADACLATRRDFEMIGELNPQVLATLRVLASSPALVPAVGCYRKDAVGPAAERYRQETFRLGETVAGKHILTLFGIDGIIELTEAQFAPTRAFLDEYARLKARHASLGAASAPRPTASAAAAGPKR